MARTMIDTTTTDSSAWMVYAHNGQITVAGPFAEEQDARDAADAAAEEYGDDLEVAYVNG